MNLSKLIEKGQIPLKELNKDGKTVSDKSHLQGTKAKPFRLRLSRATRHHYYLSIPCFILRNSFCHFLFKRNGLRPPKARHRITQYGDNTS